MTTDNTVAEIEAAGGIALGIELDGHLSVQLSDSDPPLRQTSPFLNRAHDSDALPETINAGRGVARKGTESTDLRVKAISSE